MLKKLFVFNPDTEYALASNRAYYTPSARVLQLRRENALLPALYAQQEDAILLVDTPLMQIEALPYFQIARDKGIRILTRDEAAANRESLSDFVASPWGWNKSIRQFFIDTVGEIAGVPTLPQVEKVRELSHRRTTILFFKEFAHLLRPEIVAPVELTDAEEGMRHFRADRNLYFKMPWSSSGRGIMLTDDREEMHVEPWLRGAIRQQGSVIMEKAYDRRLDFATEWLIGDCSADFIGYSVFNASRRGKYHSNVEASQADLSEMIKAAAPDWGEHWLEVQQRAIEKIIAPHYNGPLGIDMLATAAGAINPCVELNLRMTMGLVALGHKS